MSRDLKKNRKVSIPATLVAQHWGNRATLRKIEIVVQQNVSNNRATVARLLHACRATVFCYWKPSFTHTETRSAGDEFGSEEHT